MPSFEIRSSDGQVRGPFSPSDVRDLARAGQVAWTDELRVPGSTAWVPAPKVRGVREHLNAPINFDGAPVAGGQQAEHLAQPVPAAAVPAPAWTGALGTAIRDASANEGYVPQYGVLRAWARALERQGWVLIRLGFLLGVSITVLGIFGIERFLNLYPQAMIAAVVGGLAAFGVLAFVTVSWMKKSAARDRAFLWPVMVMQVTPLVLALQGFMFSRGFERGDQTMAFLAAWAVGTACFAIGFGLVIAGELLFAQADIASNSWRRQPLPKTVNR